MAFYWNDYGSYDDTPKIDSDTQSIAEQVLSTYSIPFNGTGGGAMSGIDLKRIGSLQAISMSLAEEMATTGTLKELTIDAYGTANFITVGENSMDTSDLYYSVPGESFNYTTTNVIVTGKKPVPVRSIKTPYNLLSDAKVWDDTHFMDSCYTTDWKTHAIVTFPDPHREGSSYNDGIDNAYDITNPWESIITWIWDIDPGNIPPEATVEYGSASVVPIRLSGESTGDWKQANANLGVLHHRKTVKDGANLCIDNTFIGGDWADSQVVCDGTALTLELPPELRYESIRGSQVDNFVAVREVFFTGWKLDAVWSAPKTDTDARSSDASQDTSKVFISINDPVVKVRKVVLGEEYSIGYDKGTICIKFANNAQLGDEALYGPNVEYSVFTDCYLYPESDSGEGLGCVYPLPDGTGFLVEQVFAMVHLQAPCFDINDPTGNALDIAQNLEAAISAVTYLQEPEPVAINGELIDLADTYPDNDPTTTQDLTTTAYEQALDATDSGPVININMATLDGEQTRRLSSSLRTIIEQDEGILSTYVFGPSGKPKLGDKTLTGGVINSVSYNYSDSGSYTISATEGSTLNTGLTSIGGGPQVKTTETYTNKGVITEDGGNNVMFKVRVDGYGTVTAYNSTDKFIRMGDRVGVTVHNVPVEV